MRGPKEERNEPETPTITRRNVEVDVTIFNMTVLRVFFFSVSHKNENKAKRVGWKRNDMLFGIFSNFHIMYGDEPDNNCWL